MKNFRDLINEDTDLSVINYCFKNGKTELTDMQLDAIKDTLIKEKVIWSVEQGLGKTYLCVALCNILLPTVREEKKKILICVPSNKLEDFRIHLTEKTSARVITTTGAESDVSNLVKSFSKCDFILCTPSAWQGSLEFNCLMFNNINNIYAMVYDEADGVKDKGYLHWIEIAKRFAKFVAMANGTPVGSVSHFKQGDKNKLLVTYNLLYAIDKVSDKYSKFYRDYTTFIRNDSNGFEVRDINTEKLMSTFGDYFVNLNRTDVNAYTEFEPCIFHRVVASPKQVSALNSVNDGDTSIGILYRPSVCAKYGIMPLEIAALNKLWKIVNSIPRNNNIIIYAKNTDTLVLLKQLFEQSAQIPTVIIDGQHTTSSSEKLEAENRFNSTSGCIALTNIEKGSNLGSAKNIIVYNAPSDVLQYIFRGIRGAVSKRIQLDWIYYPAYECEAMMNSMEQIRSIMELLNREIPLYQLLVQELSDAYPGHERLGI